ncbi:MAG: 3-oxoadipate enol-lactonase [Alphaproteobacteria bacterium]|nr:3-oxoadipate enol-lactonase [Alphaproteobacteria bacterium]
MHAATVDDITIHVAVEGPPNAPALVFSNSLGTDLRTWDAVIARLSDRFRCVRYDTRGHGLTDRGAAEVTITRLAADLAGLLDHLGIRETLLCGLSIGGLIAQQLIKDHPDRVRGLVLCDTASKIGTPEMWQERIDGIGKHGLDAAADGILERWFAPAFRSGKPAETAAWRNLLIRTPLDGYLACCAAIRDADLRADAARISVPTLCVGGAQDGATPPEVVRALAASIPGARFVELDQCGHLPCIEQPQALVDAMVDFFRENRFVR